MRYILKFVFVTTLFISTHAFAGEVSRAVFTTTVEAREPTIAIDSISPKSFKSIMFFTELKGLKGHTVMHQWVFDGNVIYEKSFNVNGPRWRIWTSKNLLPEWTGTWTVNVLDDDSSVLASKTFEYQ